MNKTLEDFTSQFHLNIQIVADELATYFPNTDLYFQSDSLKLDSIRMFEPNVTLSPSHLYLVSANQVSEKFRDYTHIGFLVAGTVDYTLFSNTCPLLCVGTQADFSKLFNLTCQIFEKYQKWDVKLHLALGSAKPLDDMLEASLDIFHNPIFAHDTNFYILSCPRHVMGMSVWEKDSRTGRYLVPLSLLHEFKVDREYLQSLTTKGPDIYSKQVRGYRILYRNLWIDGNYEGRICVNELQTSLLPGQFHCMEYLGTFLEYCIRRHNFFQMNLGNDTRQFFTDFLNGSITDFQKIQDFLSFLNWNSNDRYLCLRLEAEQQRVNMYSSQATLGHIEAQIPEGRAFFYKQGLAVIVNLSYEHSTVSDVISGLAIILREGLFKMGASSELHDFMLLSQGYYQASEALKLGKNSGSTSWCYRFDDYLLEYILSASCEHLSPELLCSQKLLALRKYDLQNNTELYHTLQVYLNLDQNALQSANALFIHRSTLFYRLDRIKKLTKADLDNPKERLLLLLSFQLLDNYHSE